MLMNKPDYDYDDYDYMRTVGAQYFRKVGSYLSQKIVYIRPECTYLFRLLQ